MNREQLKTILWLRWRLMCNQWRRTGGLGAVITALVGAGAVLLGLAAFTGGLLGAIFGLGGETLPQVIMWVWFGVTVFFLFVWMIGLLTELQRSETIDLQKLMHLPVALGQMFGLQLSRLAPVVEHYPRCSRDIRTGHRPRDCARAGNDSAHSAGVEHGVDDHGVDILPARLAGDDDDQPAPAPHGHHVHHAVIHSDQPGTESLFQRLFAQRFNQAGRNRRRKAGIGARRAKRAPRP